MKTVPFRHQQETFDISKEEFYYALFLEQGLGKTKIVIDTAFHLHETEHLTRVLVLAPNGVHTNWVKQELPKHAWDTTQWFAAYWKPNNSAKYRRSIEPSFLSLGLTFFTMNIEAIRTARGKAFALKYLKSGEKALIVIDESTVIKNPKAKQTKEAIWLSRQVTYKRILTGTPITQSPLDLFSQCNFLHPYAIPFSNYYSFKGNFAIEKKMTVNGRVEGETREFTKVVGYRNLDLLKKLIEPFSIRLEKKDCLDLPEKVYSRTYAQMTKEQERVYKSIKETAIALLETEEKEKGFVSVPSVLASLIKLSQVACGFIIDDDKAIHEIPCEKYKILKTFIENEPESEKFVVWTTFRHTVRKLCAYLEEHFGAGSAVSYYGETTSDERTEAIDSFSRNDNVRFFVANRAASMGLTLTKSATAIYFSNSFSLQDRLQSEDRIHRIGQDRTTRYIDLITADTVEEKIIKALEAKKDLAGTVIVSNWRDLIEKS